MISIRLPAPWRVALRCVRRWRGGFGSIALALVLLGGQSGALLHEFSHISSALAAATDPNTPQPYHDGKTCDLCLAFAQLAGAIHSDTFTTPLATDLRQTVAVLGEPAQADAATPAPRSRGPPFLS